jgi:hypothetical protein
MIATQASHSRTFTLDSIDTVAVHAAVAFDSLQSTYFSSNVTGEWDACSDAACGDNCHWQTANAFEAVTNFGGRIADGHHPDFDAISEAVFAAASMVPTPEEPGVQNVFQWGKYDDIMWWALALLQARETTDNRQLSLQFLETATAIWQQVVLVWDNVCGGGVYWDDTLTYKNSVTNELFLSTSTALYRATQNVTYLNWARKEMSWLRKSGVIDEEFFVVVDGLKVDGSTCLPLEKPTAVPGSPGTVYSYNQGLLLRGMADLAKNAKDTREEQELLELAINLTSGSMAWLSKGSALGIIQEPMWNDCNGPMFKGVYLRYLGYVAAWFAKKAPSHFHKVYKFVAIQTWAVWHIARKTKGEMSPPLRSDTSLFWASWRGTRSGGRAVYNSTYPVFIPQTSALDAFNTGVVYQEISNSTTS